MAYLFDFVPRRHDDFFLLYFYERLLPFRNIEAQESKEVLVPGVLRRKYFCSCLFVEVLDVLTIIHFGVIFNDRDARFAGSHGRSNRPRAATRGRRISIISRAHRQVIVGICKIVSKERFEVRVEGIDERQAIPSAAVRVDMVADVVAKFLLFHRCTNCCKCCCK